MTTRRAAPSVEALSSMTGDEVIAVLAEHWLELPKSERDAYTHALLEHPDRVAIFAEIYRRVEAMRSRAQN